MPFEKLELTPLDGNGAKIEAKRFKVLFNPTTYSISSAVTWTAQASRELNAPVLTYGGGAGRTLTLELFVDVTEPIDGAWIDDVRTGSSGDSGAAGLASPEAVVFVENGVSVRQSALARAAQSLGTAVALEPGEVAVTSPRLEDANAVVAVLATLIAGASLVVPASDAIESLS